ncbi:hypothetical protein IT570_07570 [Candidatus Sumerlaeota bacterium]|nr:hypothetical protein [Candidatus Sumerlaeota bacterium]
MVFSARQPLLNANFAVAERDCASGGQREAVHPRFLHASSARRGLFEHRHALDDRGLLEVLPVHSHLQAGDEKDSHHRDSGNQRRPHVSAYHLKDLVTVGVLCVAPSVVAAEVTRLECHKFPQRALGSAKVEGFARAPPVAL